MAYLGQTILIIGDPLPPNGIKLLGAIFKAANRRLWDYPELPETIASTDYGLWQLPPGDLLQIPPIATEVIFWRQCPNREKIPQIQAWRDLTNCELINWDECHLQLLAQDWQNYYWLTMAGKGSQGDFNLLRQGIYLDDGWLSACGELILPTALLKSLDPLSLILATAISKLTGLKKKMIADTILSFKP